MYQLVYTLHFDNDRLDARLERSLSLSALQNKLKTLPVSGSDNVFYASYHFTGDVSTLVRKSDLCVVVFNDVVPTRHYDHVATAIQHTWEETFRSKSHLLQIYSVDLIRFTQRQLHKDFYEKQDYSIK